MAEDKTIVIQNKPALQTFGSRLFNFFFRNELTHMRVKTKVDLDQPELHQMLTQRDQREKDGKND